MFHHAIVMETILGLTAAAVLAHRVMTVGVDVPGMLLLGLILSWGSISTRTLLAEGLVGKDEE